MSQTPEVSSALANRNSRLATGEVCAMAGKLHNEVSRYFLANRAGGGGINSITPPIRPPLLPNVFNEVEEEDE